MILSDTPLVSPAILEICEQVASSCGFRLVEARTQGKMKNLEVTIFCPQKALSINDCEQVSRKLYTQLEAQQPSWFALGPAIEVQSPGIDRRLKTQSDFKAFIGQTVEITLACKLFDLSDCFACRLTAFDGKSITVDELIPHSTTRQSARQNTVLPMGSTTIDLNQVNTVKLSSRKLSQETAHSHTAPAA
jgi:ribosome maturation factor RimP